MGVAMTFSKSREKPWPRPPNNALQIRQSDADPARDRSLVGFAFFESMRGLKIAFPTGHPGTSTDFAIKAYRLFVDDLAVLLYHDTSPAGR